ncbi:MAG: SIS domain-containing protein [Acidobacteria bacterium]|nr:SIS domain-containing protein [Acidobacteriota bacterium]
MSDLLLSRNIAAAHETLKQMEALAPTAEAAAQALAQALLAGNKLLACGNGGSAADASHMTTEFVVRFNRDRRPYPAISFATNGGDITAIGNDYEFNDLFSRQVHAFGKKGDVLIALTTSGKSGNVRRALVEAKQLGVITISLLGRDGGLCAGLADFELIVRDNVTARIQEGHKLLIHTICERVEELFLAAEKGAEK